MLNFLTKESKCFRRSINIFALLAATYSGCIKAEVASFEETPAISGYGKIHTVKEKKSLYSVSPKEISKLVFQVTQEAPKPDAANPELEKVASAINLMVADGVPTDHMNIVVIIGGYAVDTALDNTYYRKSFGIDNPNTDLLNKLHGAGVSIVVSDQAIAAKNLDSSALVNVASTALSSFTAVASLVQAGYSVYGLTSL